MEQVAYRNCETCVKQGNCTDRLNCLAGVIPAMWEPKSNHASHQKVVSAEKEGQ